ncbi:MAG: 2-oxoglutarate dehydrogenase complex dihydrolipoyllysine-residue succinyltransferase [Desulfobacterales bacterium]|nr:MAG: 2-oxoglutarate dehydrogenase complex dihydrolipoyllysine-residue succinyltransferase [Desulfobacterales bacterium]
MEIEIKIPNVGESVQEAVLVQWYKRDGDTVQKDEPLFVIETDKVTLEIVAEANGILKVLVAEGETVAIGTVVGSITTEIVHERPAEPILEKEEAVIPAEESVEKEAPAPVLTQPEPVPTEPEPFPLHQILSPSVRRLVAEKSIDVSAITGTGPGSRVTKGDVLLYMEQVKPVDSQPIQPVSKAPDIPQDETPYDPSRHIKEDISRTPMSPIRQRIASRLLQAKQNTAMLTTFNEIDMSRTMAIRAQFKDVFKKQYGVSLGFMSFFIKASVEALKAFPEINAFVEGKEVIYHHYYHVGVAIGTGRGLVVPVIRHADQLSFAQLEQFIIDYVEKVKNNRLELIDLEGGTFTITNGGVFGSLLSTPILNMPQSGILGMHKIEKRPVVIDNEVQIRPMMYVALSYDHRIVDGREAVTFLVKIKECIENPERIMMEI